jgi:prepilin-type N-terminal cleavage/methylation domain-containing protein
MWVKNKHQAGFTIVELLIVIVIIGILAAITIVAYNGIQERARASTVSSALSQATRKIGIYNAENGSYPSTLSIAGVTNTSDVSYEYNTTPTGYCITATNGTTSYKTTESSSPAQGGCAGHSQGGVAAITNLMPNPSFETNTASWSYRWYGNLGGAGTNSRPTSGGLHGPAYLRKTWTVAGAAADNGFNSTSGQIPVTAGQSYTASGAMRTNRSDYSARIGFSWYDTSGVAIGGVIWSSGTTLGANSWRRINHTATAPAGAVSLVVIYSNGNSLPWAVGDTLDFDGAMVNTASNINFADGNTTDWAWTGSPNNSTSNGPPQ